MQAVSAERILVELRKLAGGVRAHSVIKEYFDIIELVAPELRGADLPCLEIFDSLSPIERVAYMFASSSGADGWLRTAKALRLDNKTRDLVRSVLDAILKAPLAEREAVGAYLIGRTDEVVLAALHVSMALGYVDEDMKDKMLSVMTEGRPRFVKELSVNGNDLKQVGISGELTGRVLSHLLYEVATGKIKNERDLLTEEATKFV